MGTFGKLNRQFRLWLGAKTESCKSVVHLLSHSLDRELTIREKMRVKVHLFTCTACINYLSNLSFIHDVIQVTEKDFEENGRPVKLEKDAANRIKEKLISLDKME